VAIGGIVSRPGAVILREPERSERRPKDRFRAKAVNALDGQRSFVAALLRMTREWQSPRIKPHA